MIRNTIKSITDFLKFRKGTITMVFVDTGDIVEIEHASDKDTFLMYGTEYVINKECFIKNVSFYDSRFVEPISKIEGAESNSLVKAGVDITTERFNALYNSKVLKQMMYVKEKDLLLLIGIGIIALVALNTFEIWYIMKLSGALNSAMNAAQAAINAAGANVVIK